MLCSCLCSSEINILISLFRVRKTSCVVLTLAVLKVASFHHFRPCLHSFSLISSFSFDSAGVSNSEPLDPKSGPRKAGRGRGAGSQREGKGALCFSSSSPCLSGVTGEPVAVPGQCHVSGVTNGKSVN